MGTVAKIGICAGIRVNAGTLLQSGRPVYSRLLKDYLVRILGADAHSPLHIDKTLIDEIAALAVGTCAVSLRTREWLAYEAEDILLLAIAASRREAFLQSAHMPELLTPPIESCERSGDVRFVLEQVHERIAERAGRDVCADIGSREAVSAAGYAVAFSGGTPVRWKEEFADLAGRIREIFPRINLSVWCFEDLLQLGDGNDIVRTLLKFSACGFGSVYVAGERSYVGLSRLEAAPQLVVTPIASRRSILDALAIPEAWAAQHGWTPHVPSLMWEPTIARDEDAPPSWRQSHWSTAEGRRSNERVTSAESWLLLRALALGAILLPPTVRRRIDLRCLTVDTLPYVQAATADCFALRGSRTRSEQRQEQGICNSTSAELARNSHW